MTPEDLELQELRVLHSALLKEHKAAIKGLEACKSFIAGMEKACDMFRTEVAQLRAQVAERDDSIIRLMVKIALVRSVKRTTIQRVSTEPPFEVVHCKDIDAALSYTE